MASKKDRKRLFEQMDGVYVGPQRVFCLLRLQCFFVTAKTFPKRILWMTSFCFTKYVRNANFLLSHHFSFNFLNFLFIDLIYLFLSFNFKVKLWASFSVKYLLNNFLAFNYHNFGIYFGARIQIQSYFLFLRSTRLMMQRFSFFFVSKAMFKEGGLW